MLTFPLLPLQAGQSASLPLMLPNPAGQRNCACISHESRSNVNSDWERVLPFDSPAHHHGCEHGQGEHPRSVRCQPHGPLPPDRFGGRGQHHLQNNVNDCYPNSQREHHQCHGVPGARDGELGDGDGAHPLRHHHSPWLSSGHCEEVLTNQHHKFRLASHFVSQISKGKYVCVTKSASLAAIIQPNHRKTMPKRARLACINLCLFSPPRCCMFESGNGES